MSAQQQRKHIPLGVGLYSDWWYINYGIPFDKKYYFDPETRVEAQREMSKILYERFGDVGLGDPNPAPKPLITFGMVMLPAVYGCETIFEKDALPWAVPLNLTEEQIDKLEKPDLLSSSPMKEMVEQMDYLEAKYGKIVGDINTTGVLNLAMKIRGEALYTDFYENPELCHKVLRLSAESMIELFHYVYKRTGTGAMDTTVMAPPEVYVVPNCAIEQISLKSYNEFVLAYDSMVADACQPFGIHHCGSIDEVLAGYAKIKNLSFLEVGFGSDVAKTRQVLGPDVAINARIDPVLMKNGSVEEVVAEAKKLIDQGRPYHNFSIDTVGLSNGTPDENIKAARRTAMEYGKLSD
jgi:uroporphyrinogen-III decarboxylase